MEDAAVLGARRAAESAGRRTPAPRTVATLSFLAAAANARHVASVGAGAGVTSLGLLRGMTDDGVLTTVDVDAEGQRLARTALDQAGISRSRARLITGVPAEVLPRLSDDAYDLVLLDAPAAELDGLLDEALRLLRDGGLLAVVGVDEVAAAGEGDDAEALRSLAARVREEEGLVEAVLPVEGGLLVAVAHRR